MNLLLAPLQGFTDVKFRNAWHKHFDGINSDYAPYISLQNDGTIRGAQLRDINPDNNDVLPVPQILPSSPEEALRLTQTIVEYNTYKHININMGCPYPMVTNRGRGSGLLNQSQTVYSILEKLTTTYGDNIQFSVKMRSGLLDASEMNDIFDVLNDFPILHVIVHPRIGKRLYKGEAVHDDFIKAAQNTSHPIIYNGDISTPKDYAIIRDKFPKLDGVMLGRGILQNPLLPNEIKTGNVVSLEEKLTQFESFHDTLFRLNAESLSGESHLLNKMKSYIPYFSQFNIENKKVYKMLKKSQSIRSYQERMRLLFAVD